jgi:hypothetical protein
MDRYTLDTCDWPIILNDGDVVVALFPQPKIVAGGTDASATLAELEREQIERANTVARLLNAQR